MMSFLEFYVVLVDHVVFKLEKDHERKLELAEQRADEAPEPEGEEANATGAEAQTTSKVFESCTFYLGREVPDKQLRFLIESFGGSIASDENNANITHQVVDRPNVPDRRADRDYVQPQWIFDCANKRELIHVEPYEPGKQLPPHMSPFEEALQHRVEWEKAQAAGKTAAAERALRAQREAEEDELSEAEDEFQPDENLEDKDIVTSDEEWEKDSDEEEEKPKAKAGKKETKAAASNEPVSKLQLRSSDAKKSTKRQREEEETQLKLELATNKKRKLYKQIQRTEKRKQGQKDQLAGRFHELRKEGKA
jgi:pescadillo protein